jgi:hypothetical protein
MAPAYTKVPGGLTNSRREVCNGGGKRKISLSVTMAVLIIRRYSTGAGAKKHAETRAGLSIVALVLGVASLFNWL